MESTKALDAPLNTVQHGSYVVSIFLGLAGLALAALTVTMGYEFGHAMAGQEKASTILGASSVSVDILVVILAMTVGLMVRSKKYIPAIVISAALVPFVVYSMSSTIGFSAQHRIAKSESSKRQATENNNLARKQNEIALQMRQDTVSWMQKTATSEAATPSEKKRLLGEISALTKQPVELANEFETPKDTDIQANIFADLLALADITVDPQKIQIAMAVLLSVLMVSGKALAFSLSAYVWPIALPAPAKSQALTAVATTSAPSLAIGPVQQSAIGGYDPEPDAPFAHDEEPRDMTDFELVDMLGPDARKQFSMRESVQTFLNDCTYASATERVTAAQIYDAYVAWATRNGQEPMSQNMLGRICTTLRVVRDNGTRRKAWYVGLGLIGGDQTLEPVAAAA